jgi:lipopolysaccharide export system permease protein
VIVTRYLTKEVYITLCVVTGVLVLIFLSNQFIRYLGYAAAGKYSGMIVLKIMALQIPYLLGLLLPVSLFLAIMLAYGRLYADSEMTVLFACGMSKTRLIGITLALSLIVAIFVGILSFYVNPKLLVYQEQLRAAEANSLLDTVMPGRFYVVDKGNQVYYVEETSSDRKYLKNVFMAQYQQPKKTEGKVAKDQPPPPKVWGVVAAARGYQAINSETGDNFLVVEDGNRYVGAPGEKDFQLIQFERYGLRLLDQTIRLPSRSAMLSNKQLWSIHATDPEAAAELQWRLSAPLSVPLLALLAVPLSRIPPRRGRYIHLLPAIMLYALYANMMFVAKDWIEHKVISPQLGLWWLQGLILLLALILLINKGTWKRWFCHFRWLKFR